MSKGSINEVRRLSDDTIKEMVASSGKKHLLPTEVCFVAYIEFKSETQALEDDCLAFCYSPASG